MNILEKAWTIIEKFDPFLIREGFDNFLKENFDPNKSIDENKKIIINKIADGEAGYILAIAAQSLREHLPVLEESEKIVETENVETLKERFGEEIQEANKQIQEAEATSGNNVEKANMQPSKKNQGRKRLSS